MSMLLSKNCHEACAVRIKKYLEERDGQNRVIAKDFINLYSKDETEHWDIYMDKTRHYSGNDRDWGNKKAVTYQHFVISPDPRDHVDAESLMELSKTWAHEFFGYDDMTPGKLGSYEVAIYIHNDNENEVMHAHIIVNNTDLDTGKRLQRKNDMSRQIMPNRLQELAKERGLSYFDNDNPENKKHTSKRRYYTKVELHRIRSGYFSWKEDLANMIDIARYTTKDEATFLKEMEALGVQVEERENDWLFRHPGNPERWKINGYRLGTAYSKPGIVNNLDSIIAQSYPRNDIFRENVNTYLSRSRLAVELFEEQAKQDAEKEPNWNDLSSEEQDTLYKEFIDHARTVAVVDYGMDLALVAETIKTNIEFKITSKDDYDRRMGAVQKSMQKASKEYAKELNRQLLMLESAKNVAQSGDFFKGVKLPTSNYAQRIKEATKPRKKQSTTAKRRQKQQAQARERRQQRDTNKRR